jgi:hypothetical protein
MEGSSTNGGPMAGGRGGSKGSKISALIDECDFIPLSQEQRDAAARVVCGHPSVPDAGDARELMAMLGLMPGQEAEYLDVVVGTSTSSTPPLVRHDDLLSQSRDDLIAF